MYIEGKFRFRSRSVNHYRTNPDNAGKFMTFEVLRSRMASAKPYCLEGDFCV